MDNIYNEFPEFYNCSFKSKKKYIVVLIQGNNKYCVFCGNFISLDVYNFDYIIIANRKTGTIIERKCFLDRIF